MRSSVKSSKRRKDLTGQAVRRSVLLRLSLALILSAGGCSKQSTEEVPQLLDPVTVEAGTVTVKRGDLANITYINVSVVPKTEKLTFAREGQISAIHVAAGDQVTKGQVLAELDLTDLSKEIDRQSAQLDFQKNQDDLAETAAYDTLLAAQADQQAAQAAYQEAYQALTQAQEQAAKQQTAASDPAEENSQPARASLLIVHLRRSKAVRPKHLLSRSHLKARSHPGRRRRPRSRNHLGRPRRTKALPCPICRRL